MDTIRTKLGHAGRINIPATMRQNLSLNIGDDIILHVQDNMICITTPNQALQSLQEKVKHYNNTSNKTISLVDELIAQRRSEVKNEQ